MGLLASCSYHLVGSGGGVGVIPSTVQQLQVGVDSGQVNEVLGKQLLQYMQAQTLPYNLSAVEDDRASDAILTGPIDDRVKLVVKQGQEFWQPSAYTTSGLVSQYRLTWRASLTLYERGGRVLWESGLLSESGEVYDDGTGIGVEAAKEMLLQQLAQQWVAQAWARLQSGF